MQDIKNKIKERLQRYIGMPINNNMLLEIHSDVSAYLYSIDPKVLEHLDYKININNGIVLFTPLNLFTFLYFEFFDELKIQWFQIQIRDNGDEYFEAMNGAFLFIKETNQITYEPSHN